MQTLQTPLTGSDSSYFEGARLAPLLDMGDPHHLCAAALLNLLGLSFDSPRSILEAPTGPFTHTILEWSAFSVAMFTFALAFLHFAAARDAAALVIGTKRRSKERCLIQKSQLLTISHS